MLFYSGSSDEYEGSSTLSEYEKKREKRIKENKKVLAKIMKVHQQIFYLAFNFL